MDSGNGQSAGKVSWNRFKGILGAPSGKREIGAVTLGVASDEEKRCVVNHIKRERDESDCRQQRQNRVVYGCNIKT